MNGSASQPSSAAMKGTLEAISPAMKATSRESRSSLATTMEQRDLLGSRQGCRELWPALQRIGAFASLDLDELARDSETLALAELDDRPTLRFQAQAGAPLPSGRHADVGDRCSGQLNAPSSVSRYFTDLRFRPLRHARFNERCKRPGQLGV